MKTMFNAIIDNSIQTYTSYFIDKLAVFIWRLVNDCLKVHLDINVKTRTELKMS